MTKMVPEKFTNPVYDETDTFEKSDSDQGEVGKEQDQDVTFDNPASPGGIMSLSPIPEDKGATVWLFPGVEPRSLFCLEQSNGFRQLLITMIQRKEFDAFILLVIVANAVLMAVEDPLRLDGPEAWQENLSGRGRTGPICAQCLPS
jgi:hypothetical protein